MTSSVKGTDALKDSQCDVLSLYEKKISKLLTDAVKEADVSVVRFLMSKGILPTEQLLESAIRKRDADKIVLLLSHEYATTIFSVETRQRALVTAIELEYLEIVTLLLTAGNVDPNFVVCKESRGMPLHIAISNAAIVNILLGNGADPNARCSRGCTPLHIVGGNHRSARLLIAHGGDPNVQHAEKASPLHIICCEGEFLTAKEMYMADFELEDEDGWTALHCAISSRNMDLIKWLVNHGANPNPHGEVLSLEIACNCRMMPLPLIALGMDPWHRNVRGETIAHLAMCYEHDLYNYYDDDVDGESNIGPSKDFHMRFMDSIFREYPTLINAQDQNGNQPIHYTRRASPETIRALVQNYGADLAASSMTRQCKVCKAYLIMEPMQTDLIKTGTSLFSSRRQRPEFGKHS